jgi:hypothetical protein
MLSMVASVLPLTTRTGIPEVFVDALSFLSVVMPVPPVI